MNIEIERKFLVKNIPDNKEDTFHIKQYYLSISDKIVQRLRIFDAIYFPDEEKRTELKDERTSVNTFRTVFNSYFGSEYEMLEDKMYWGWNKKPYYFEEVTQFLQN